MALQTGTRVGPYEVTALIGAGGMGEVYRAHDTKLNRDVALKILPEQFALDADRLARFKREAQVLASLNHPNIAAIYGLEETDGVRALVLELVEGPTLADRIAQRPIPLDEALPVARQIAEALEAAHEQGIIHRDLKPANVKVRQDETVKVLDFGLAKALSEETAGSDLSQSPTMSVAATRAGVILGTAAYMSPEQARGKAVDGRTDIWAFGCVLYEMLTGKRAFDGDDVSDTLARILMKEPDWDVVPATTPAALHRLLHRCLVKDRTQRLQHVGDARLEIRDALAAPSAESIDAVEVTSRERLRWAMAGLAIGALVTGAVAGIAGWRVARSGSATAAPPQHFNIDLPEGTVLPTGVGTDIAISPDGRTLVFVTDGAGGRRLYLRRLDGLETVPIPGTEGAVTPFFSPDGQWVAFQAADFRQIKRVPLSGGEPLTLCDPCVNGFWGNGGDIVFDWEGSLWRIPEVGGTPERLAEPMPERGVPALTRPVLLPGGKAVLFEIGSGDFGGVGVLSLENNEIVVVSTDGSDPLYSSTGHILFPRGNRLFAVPFDVEGFEVTGPAVPVLQGVRVENGGALQADVSRDGLLVHAPAGAAIGTQLVWADRNGNVKSMLEQWRVFYAPRISPDGERIAVQINTGGNTDIWIRELESGTLRRLTTRGVAANPLWTPDGTRLAFSSGAAASFVIQWVPADGSGEVKTLLSSKYPILPEAWAPDGNHLVFREDSPDPNLFVVDVRDGRSRTAFLESDFSENSATFSHSGQWLAYVSDRSGSDEVYVRPFPGPGAEYVISSGGGIEPVWGLDDTELFYRTSDGRSLLVASLQTGPFRVLRRAVLFEAPDFWSSFGRAQYDIHPDGQRLLMMNMRGTDVDRPKLNVVLNWFEEMKRLMPTK